MSRSLLRVAAPVVLGVAVLGGCAGSSSTTETTLSPNATPWRTVPPVSATEIPTSLAVANVQYTAKQGDYANSIAAIAGGGCSGAEILAANPGMTTINAGDVVNVPANCLGPGVTQDILNGTVIPDTAAPAEKTTTTAAAESYNIYVVKSGDFWVRIARRTGCTYRQLKAANPGVTKLFPKQELNVPKSCDTRKN
jgi:hypothetical protein